MNPLPYIKSIEMCCAGTSYEMLVVNFKDNTPIDALIAEIPREFTNEDQEF